MLILSVGSAVNAQQERNLGSFHVTDRISQQAVNFRSIFTLEIDVFGLTKLKLIHQRIILMSKLAKLLTFHRINFRRLHVITRKQDRVATGDR